MTTAQVVETSVTVTNSSFQNYTHLDDHTRQTTDTDSWAQTIYYSNIYLPTEDDDYAKCAGDALKKCILRSWTMFEYIECMGDEAKTCPKPTMNHFMRLMKAKKNLKEIAEKQSGEEPLSPM